MPKRSRSPSCSFSPCSTISDSNSPLTEDGSPEPPNKLTQLDPVSFSTPAPAMKCYLPPHEPLSFSSFQAYQQHYEQMHVNRCLECSANFPDNHLLQLHISENHDPFVQARKAKGEKTYACLVQGCDRVCSTPQKRRRHCIDKHQFPEFYDFFIVNEGIDRRNSMLRTPRRRAASTAMSIGDGGTESPMPDPSSTPRGMQTAKVVPRTRRRIANQAGKLPEGGADEDQGQQVGNIVKTDESSQLDSSPEAAMDGITARMSALSFVPRSVQLRRKGRGGFAKT